MLDTQTAFLLQNLVEKCNDGKYKVLDKEELLNDFPKKMQVSKESLQEMIQHLQEREYLNMKYSDSKVYCLNVLPKGRLFKEKSNEVVEQKKKYNRLIVGTMVISCCSAFLGAFSAMLIFKFFF